MSSVCGTCTTHHSPTVLRCLFVFGQHYAWWKELGEHSEQCASSPDTGVHHNFTTLNWHILILGSPLPPPNFTPFFATMVDLKDGNSIDSSMVTETSSQKYGGCEGPDAMYVKLISADKQEFIIKREHALTSGTIKAMLSGPGQFSENETNEVNFREIPSHILQKICAYFTYKVRYANSVNEIPEFQIDPEIALELLMAANFLDC